ncbi:hypothetical protein SASPL_153781 [Salvia splendens]|uniref:Uncharacterized protein n=1 Tax=Salvia splendens TaxID=180675 RepID=A0A8X8YYP4_SALSN|nr:hypothetical protein SASPL_153781 [Salvia splendens]
MSSGGRAGQAAGALARARRLAKGKAVADGETSGKRKSVGGVPVQTKRPQLRIKRTTRFFWRILKSMNERQKNAVRQLGFGGLLDEQGSQTDFARQVNGMLNKAPSNEQCNQPARKRSKMK